MPSVMPVPSDILCGQDNRYSRHPGNQAFRRRLKPYVQIYSEAQSRSARSQITREILLSLRGPNGSRFVKLGANGDWSELSERDSRDKISHALRIAVKKAQSGPKPRRVSRSSGPCVDSLASDGPRVQPEGIHSPRAKKQTTRRADIRPTFAPALPDITRSVTEDNPIRTLTTALKEDDLQLSPDSCFLESESAKNDERDIHVLGFVECCLRDPFEVKTRPSICSLDSWENATNEFEPLDAQLEEMDLGEILRTEDLEALMRL